MQFTEQEDEHAPHSAAERAEAASRSTWVSVVVNVVLASAQIIVGTLTKSQALIADGIHSLSDLVSDFVVLFAGHHAKKDADDDHPYGHQRFETAASLALGLILLAVGGGMVWSALGKLESPDTIAPAHTTALWVALGAIVTKELLFRYMLRVAKAVKSSLLVANAWHARSDAASSLVVSLGILGSMAGYPLLDPIAALIVGFMVGKMGWSFAWDALHDLMDRGLDEAEVQAIRATLLATPGVDRQLDGLALGIVPVVVDGLRAAGMDDTVVVVGGIIPDADADYLRERGVAAVFTPKDYDATAIMGAVLDEIRSARGLTSATR